MQNSYDKPLTVLVAVPYSTVHPTVSGSAQRGPKKWHTFSIFLPY